MIQSVLVFDLAAILSMLVVANLSKRLGEALKIRPYYQLLYLAAILVFAAFSIDTFLEPLHPSTLDMVSVTLRCVAGIVALPACLPYWKWLFPEYFHRRK
jgi:hypothetical protein